MSHNHTSTPLQANNNNSNNSNVSGRTKLNLDEYHFNYQVHAQRAEIRRLEKEKQSLEKTLQHIQDAVSPKVSAQRIDNYIASTEEPLLFPNNDCFTGNTEIVINIEMINGSRMNIKRKQIKDIKVGDLILSQNLGIKKYLISNNESIMNHNEKNDGNRQCNSLPETRKIATPLNQKNKKIDEMARTKNKNRNKNSCLSLCQARVTHIYCKQVPLSNLYEITFENEIVSQPNSQKKTTKIQCTLDHPFWCENKQLWCNISGNAMLDNTYKNSNVNNNNSNNDRDRDSSDNMYNENERNDNNLYARMGQLAVDDTCVDLEGNLMSIKNIEQFTPSILNSSNNGSTLVYNMTVDSTQTYFANNILVHNKCPCVIM